MFAKLFEVGGSQILVTKVDDNDDPAIRIQFEYEGSLHTTEYVFYTVDQRDAVFNAVADDTVEDMIAGVRKDIDYILSSEEDAE